MMALPARTIVVLIALPVFTVCAATLYYYHIKDKEWKRYLKHIQKEEEEIKVPLECVGNLIGRGGTNIKELQDKTQTKINFKGTVYHKFEIRLKMWLMDLGRPVEIPTLNEARAIELGCNMLGESIVFGTAALILLNEYRRSMKNEAIKSEARKREMEELQDSLQQLSSQLEEHSSDIKKLRQSVNDVKHRVGLITPFDPSYQ